ncbi:EF-hand domain-containing protein [Lysobacter yangpyeongensis]|uniref:EF-hand domain-containing protein n=1 Tax=Lysobacter yangpyeongensis TaxID=346182 RepID=A0ABW0SRU4_9GAMM
MNLSRKTLLGTFALVATLSAPLAFAQTDTSATDASAQQSTPPTDTSTTQSTTTDTQTTTSNDASAATMQGDAPKKSWNDIDLDKDGSLTKAEAAAVPALGQVFDKADSNADGALSADEYKAYVQTSSPQKDDYK